MKNNGGIIYCILNVKNNKRYIGLTTRVKGFKGRYSSKGEGIERVYNYLSKRKETDIPYNEYLFRSIKKYGFKNFKVDEMFDKAKTNEELKQKEIKWIKYYQSNDSRFGYNFTTGGEGLDKTEQNFITKIKRRITVAKNYNAKIERAIWHHSVKWGAISGEAPPNLNKDGELIVHLKRLFPTSKIRVCKICGIQYKKDGKGGYCNHCGDENFLKEYKKHKKIIKKYDLLGLNDKTEKTL